MEFTAPELERRLGDHELHGDIITRRLDRHGRGLADHDIRADQRDGLHFHGQSDQRERHRGRLGCIEQCDACDCTGRTNDRHRHWGQRAGVGCVHSASFERRQCDHELHSDIVAGRAYRNRYVYADLGDWSHERYGLYVHGDGDERRRHQCAIIGVEQCNARNCPGAPTIGTATRGNGQATVAFTAPASNGGSAITGYTATSSPGGFTGTGTSAPITVTGLTNGTDYTFTVTATNAKGTGAASGASNSVTPALSVPGAPTIGTVTGGNGQASVAFTAPASNGGSAITGYTVTSSPGGFTATGTSAPITVTGLTNGTAYTFTVKATNANGTGANSAASSSVTPATAPGAPTIGTVTGGNGQASVAFTPPTSNGGSAITSYTVTSSPGGLTATGTSTPISVHRLDQRYGLYVQGDGDERRRHQRAIIGVEQCDASDCAGRANKCQRDRWQCASDCHVLAAGLEWRITDHWLHGDIVAGWCHRDRHGGADHCDGPHQRNRLYVHREGDERRWHGRSVHGHQQHHASDNAGRSGDQFRDQGERKSVGCLCGAGIERWQCDHEL